MEADLSIWHLFWNASRLVQFVMLILLAGSFVSWMVIFRRYKVFKQSRQEADAFEQSFWSTDELMPLYHEINKPEQRNDGMAHIFVTGMKEFGRLRNQQGTTSTGVMEGVQRVMRAALQREAHYLDQYLSFLATVGSISPYIGLFGTVWGIMNSFRALGNVHHATIAMVAPGIAEALIATAMGLFAAIPAVIAYNRFNHDSELLLARYNTFADEFSAVLQRHLHA